MFRRAAESLPFQLLPFIKMTSGGSSRKRHLLVRACADRMLRTRVLSSTLHVLCAYFCFAFVAKAQVQPGFPSFNPMDCQDGICVNPANNNVVLQAPIRSKKGVIGFNSSLTGNYFMSYNPVSGVWYPSVVDSFLATYGPNVNGTYIVLGNLPVNLSFAGSVNGVLGGTFNGVYVIPTSSKSNVSCTSGSGTTTQYALWVLITGDGTVHTLGGSTDKDSAGNSCITGSGFTVVTDDYSGLTVTVAANATSGATSIYTKDGTSLTASSITDRNGNTISTSGSTVTDSMGVTALTATNWTTGPFKWTDINGGTQQVSITTASKTVQTNFYCSSPLVVSDFPATVETLPTGITFADNTTESWTYEKTPGYSSNVTGRLGTVTLPTGGTVQFTYGQGSDTTCHNGISSTYQVVPVLTKTLGNGDQTTYTWSNNSFGPTNTVLDPGGNQTVYYYNGATGNIAAIYRYQGTSTLIDSTYYCYLPSYIWSGESGTAMTLSLCAQGYYDGDDYSYYQEMLPNGQANEQVVVHQYANASMASVIDTKFDTSGPGDASYGNVVYQATYDYLPITAWTSGTPTPLKTVGLTYGTCSARCNTSASTISAIGNNINDKIGLVVTQQNGVTVGQVAYTYSTTAGHAGNLLTTTAWTGSTYLSNPTANSYLSNGTPAATYDFANNATQYSYSSAGYKDGCNGKYPFPTTVLNTGTGLYTTATYDCEGGVMLSASDASGSVNNYATTFCYNTGTFSSGACTGGTADPYWRVLQTIDPYGADVISTYPSSSSPTTSSSSFEFNSSNSIEATTRTVDGYGRPINSQTNQSPGGSYYDTVSTAYKWLTSGSGTNYFQVTSTQPCSITGGLSCTTTSGSTGVHTSWYDPLHRLYQESTTSNETITNAYVQNDVLTTLGPAPTGENLKQTQTQYDALGRPTLVCHIGSTASTGSGTACNQNTGSLYGETDSYLYYQTSGLTEVQISRGSQSRAVWRDALGRVIQSQTPEGGTWHYYYDLASCTGSTASAGNLTCSKDPNGNTLLYFYDAMNRVTEVNANGTTCRRFYYDNTGGYSGTVPSGITLSNQYGRLNEAATDTCAANTLITDEWFNYDEDGRQTNNWRNTYAGSRSYYNSTATFFANGAINTLHITSPAIFTLTYGLDGEGRWNSLTDTTAGQNIVTAVNRFPAYNPEVVQLTGTTPDNDAYTIDANTGRINQYVFSVGNTPTTLKGVLTWNPNGSLASLATTDGFDSGGSMTCNSNSAGSLGYGYDDWGRLNEFDCGSGKWGQQYSYDVYDNLTKTVLSGRTGTTWSPGYSPTTNQCLGCTFDSDGNTTSDGSGTNYWGWNEFAKQAWYNTSSSAPNCASAGECITYDAFGHIYNMSGSGIYTDVWNMQVGSADLTPSGDYFMRFPAPGGHGIVEINGDDTGHNYLHGDWLGNARLMSSVVTNTEYVDRAYTPYGEQFATFGQGYTQYQSFAGMTGDFNPGIQYETPNREFTLAAGRWLSPDPSGQGGQWNRYAYVTNPNSMADPSGLGGPTPVPFEFGGCWGAPSSGPESCYNAGWTTTSMDEASANVTVSATYWIGRPDAPGSTQIGGETDGTQWWYATGPLYPFANLDGTLGGLTGNVYLPPGAGDTSLPSNARQIFDGVNNLTAPIVPYLTAAFAAEAAFLPSVGSIDPVVDPSIGEVQPLPPGWTEEWELGPATRSNEPDSWWDPDGGEWNWQDPDSWHDEGHWNYNPWDHASSPWQNIYLPFTF
jgi:RHS repeat-associated protein